MADNIEYARDAAGNPPRRVQALISDPSFQGRFLRQMEKAFFVFRDSTQGDALHELELLSWTEGSP